MEKFTGGFFMRRDSCHLLIVPNQYWQAFTTLEASLSSDQTMIEVLDGIIANIERDKDTHISKLLASDHTQHDRLVGYVAGLQRAKSVILMKRKSLFGGDDSDE